MSDDRRIELKNELDGYWEYECKVSSAILFDNDETSRGGQIHMMVDVHKFGVSARLEAKRLWFVTEQKDEVRKTWLPKPVPWESEGGVVISDGSFWFQYRSTDQHGLTQDRFRLNETLELGDGTFTHFRSDGKMVTGTVTLKKLPDGPGNFTMSPPLSEKPYS